MKRFILSIGALLFISTVVLGQDWKNRENWPADFPRPPKTEKRLFFLQRNVNRNTIAYDLNFKSDGTLDMKEPLDVYWMRYTGNRNGLREEITWFQENFAFGYNTQQNKQKEELDIKLVAYKERKVCLKKLNGQWTALMKINGKECQLSNIYVYADESGLLPDVQHVDLYGKDLLTGKEEYERFFAP